MLSSEHCAKSGLREEGVSRVRWLTTILLGGDALCICAALSLGYWLRFVSAISGFGVASGPHPTLELYQAQFVLAVLTMLALLWVNGRYGREVFLRPLYSALMVLKPVLIWGLFFVSLSLFLKIEPSISRLFVAYSMGVLLVMLPVWRYLFAAQLIRPFFAPKLRQKTLVVGWNRRVAQLVELSEARGNMFPLRVTGVVSTDSEQKPSELPREIKSWHLPKDYGRVIQSSDCETVLLADSALDHAAKIELHRLCAREMKKFVILPDHIATLPRCLSVQMVQGIPLLAEQNRPLDRLDVILVKRLLDIVGALVGLCLFAPVILYFAWRVKRESPGPALYRQIRSGYNGQPFEIIKIRSMRMDAEAETGPRWCVPQDERCLQIGAFMRRWNIDELPQFWNVLKGEMSLVGPRPERPGLIEKFKFEVDFYNMRHTVKPGMTGWAQVNGWRGDTDLSARIACDIEYIDRAGLWFDIYILLRTITARTNAY